jgi:ACS family pantothenate transporter-like MFS transporter
MFLDISKSPMRADASSPESGSLSDSSKKKSLRLRIREIVWDSLDRLPDERKLIFKLDIFIL